MIRFYSYFKIVFVFSLFACCFSESRGQDVLVHGTVFNMYRTRPLDGVSVLCSCGTGTTTDSNGNYYIRVSINDSLRFSYLGRATQFFPVMTINQSTSFDIALHVNPTELHEVRVAPKNYHMDSLQNRQDYAKIFNYKKPGIELSNGPSGAGLDLDAIINMFAFKKNRRMLAFQQRLIEDEEDKFVEHRFSIFIIHKITGLQGDALDSFRRQYRPSYLFTKSASDYEFYDYIKLAYQEYQARQRPRPGPANKPHE